MSDESGRRPVPDPERTAAQKADDARRERSLTGLSALVMLISAVVVYFGLMQLIGRVDKPRSIDPEHAQAVMPIDIGDEVTDKVQYIHVVDVPKNGCLETHLVCMGSFADGDLIRQFGVRHPTYPACTAKRTDYNGARIVLRWFILVPKAGAEPDEQDTVPVSVVPGLSQDDPEARHLLDLPNCDHDANMSDAVLRWDDAKSADP